MTVQILADGAIELVSSSGTIELVSNDAIVEIVSGGPTGPTGPPGPGASSFIYVHDQPTPATTWTMVHGLNAFPNMTTVDTAGTVIHGTVIYVNANTITATFSLPQSGKAYFS